MELMNDSVIHFLESSPQLANPLPRPSQHLSQSYNSSSIVHRDLSSNNVLLIDIGFGMASLGDLNLHATCVTNTMCPGTAISFYKLFKTNQCMFGSSDIDTLL
jgi:hypothetical protein